MSYLSKPLKNVSLSLLEEVHYVEVYQLIKTIFLVIKVVIEDIHSANNTHQDIVTTVLGARQKLVIAFYHFRCIIICYPAFYK